MIRRNFLKIIIGVLGIGFIDMFASKSVFAQNIYDKIRNRLNPSTPPGPDSERGEAAWPEEGITVSVETALNSRCTSDYDENPKAVHWGMFDKTKKLTSKQIEQIKTYARVPRFTDTGLEIANDNNILTFTIGNHTTQPLRDWAMIESGMQQQAVGLVCAVLGAGYVFNTLGVDGKSISNNKFGAVRIKLDAMKPSYNGSYWNTAAPTEISPWQHGTLPDPVRQGKKALLSILKELQTANEKGKPVSTNDLSQLLWAARGRTPHFYLSNPWSMTLPTYQGKNNISEVYTMMDGAISKYINWDGHRPTHSLEPAEKIDVQLEKVFASQYKPYNCFIILSKNETMARALWEIGYQLLNMMLQAQSLGVRYKAILFDENQKKLFKTSSIKDPVAVLLLQKNGV
jgi:hypothetical protein